jgi:serralysin
MDAGRALTTSYLWRTASVTWGDPRRGLDYGAGYRSDDDGDGHDAPFDGFAGLTARQLAAARFALDLHGDGPGGRAGFAVEGFTGLAVRYAGADSASADIRLANTRDAGTAYAYLPGGGQGGDVWLGGGGRGPEAGNYDQMTVLHEIGHALGLEHGHEAGLARSLDTPEFTVMTYRGWEGASPTGYRFEEWGAPQTWMMLDIAALQALYGADFRVNADDTVYRWQPGSGRTWVNGEVGIDPGGEAVFATIWDGGGRDRYDLRAYDDGLRLDLRPGQHSVLDRDQLAYLGGGPNDGHARGSVFNALQYRGDGRSLIEDAQGGSGDDRLTGNAAGNRLSGGAGDDRLAGLGGADTLVGGRGDDVFGFAGVGSSRPGRCDRLRAGDGAAAFEGTGRGSGDRIDVSGIDADLTRRGDQAFAFGAGGGPGRLWLDEVDDVTFVRGNVDRGGAPEFELAIFDGAVGCDDYRAGDFVL